MVKCKGNSREGASETENLEKTVVFVTSGCVSDQCQIFARFFSFIPSQKNFVKIVFSFASI